MKSIAVPVTRKSVTASKKKRPGRPTAPAAPPDAPLAATPLARPKARSLMVSPSNHVAAAPRPVIGHRYHVGQRLRMANGGRTWARPDTICRVLALLPIEGGPLRYRVRSEAENFERIVDEIDLTPAG